MSKFPMCPYELAEEIGIPIKDWPLNCHGIAEAVLRFTPVKGMRLVRGHWHGYISRKSQYHRGGPQQHTWLEAEDGRILDPTRWAMVSPDKPFIYLGDNDDYDEAGLQLSSRVAPMLLPRSECPFVIRLSKADPSQIDALTDAMGTSRLNNKQADSRDLSNLADRIKYILKSPVDHLDNPQDIYGALQQAGMKSFIKLDLWNSVMEVEKVMRVDEANRWYTLPEFKKQSPVSMFFDLCARFISIEEREIDLEDELEELGYTLDAWHNALNEVEWCAKNPIDLVGEGFNSVPRDRLDPLVVVSSWLLGKGFGTDLRVERFAKSRGYDRQSLDRLLRDSGERVGYDNSWIA